MFKKILYIIGGLIVVLAVVGIVLPKECILTEKITIARSTQEVFDYVKLLKNQEEYSVWLLADPFVQINYVGTDGTEGFTAEWESTKRSVGEGEQQIAKIEEGKSILVKIQFDEPMESVANALTSVEDAGNGQTLVTNTFMTPTPFPSNLMTRLFKGSVQKDMQQNLVNLKNILEQ